MSPAIKPVLSFVLRLIRIRDDIKERSAPPVSFLQHRAALHSGTHCLAGWSAVWSAGRVSISLRGPAALRSREQTQRSTCSHAQEHTMYYREGSGAQQVRHRITVN